MELTDIVEIIYFLMIFDMGFKLWRIVLID
jgi:hypothetical protein